MNYNEFYQMTGQFKSRAFGYIALNQFSGNKISVKTEQYIIRGQWYFEITFTANGDVIKYSSYNDDRMLSELEAWVALSEKLEDGSIFEKSKLKSSDKGISPAPKEKSDTSTLEIRNEFPNFSESKKTFCVEFFLGENGLTRPFIVDEDGHKIIPIGDAYVRALHDEYNLNNFLTGIIYKSNLPWIIGIDHARLPLAEAMKYDPEQGKLVDHQGTVNALDALNDFNKKVTGIMFFIENGLLIPYIVDDNRNKLAIIPIHLMQIIRNEFKRDEFATGVVYISKLSWVIRDGIAQPGEQPYVDIMFEADSRGVPNPIIMCEGKRVARVNVKYISKIFDELGLSGAISTSDKYKSFLPWKIQNGVATLED